MIVPLLVALATVLGLAGDAACKAWCRTGAPWLFTAAWCCWVPQCAIWFPIFQRAGYARAIALSSAMWILVPAAVGVFTREPMTRANWFGVALAFVAVLLLIEWRAQ